MEATSSMSCSNESYCIKKTKMKEAETFVIWSSNQIWSPMFCFKVLSVLVRVISNHVHCFYRMFLYLGDRSTNLLKDYELDRHKTCSWQRNITNNHSINEMNFLCFNLLCPRSKHHLIICFYAKVFFWKQFFYIESFKNEKTIVIFDDLKLGMIITLKDNLKILSYSCTQLILTSFRLSS